MSPRWIGQRARLGILAVYLLGLLVASRSALGTWIPPTTERGIWFYSALAALLLGNLLVSPFFTKPADAISFSVAAMIPLLVVNPWSEQAVSGFDQFTWSIAMLYVAIILTSAVIAIAFKDSSARVQKWIARSAFLLADVGGNPRAIFSIVFFFALITFHRATPREYLIISLAWAVFVGFRPLEALIDLLTRIRTLWVIADELPRLGDVVSHQTPSLVLVREVPEAHARFGDLMIARTERGQPGVAIALDHVGFAGGRWLRALHPPHSAELASGHCEGPLERAVIDGSVLSLTADSTLVDAKEAADHARKRLVGLVSANTDIGQIQVELVRSDTDLQEGSLVQVEIKNQPVLYQVIEGLTREEILQEKNSRGFVRARAKKIGSWDRERASFTRVPWLPDPNRPVYLIEMGPSAVETEAIGHFPGTSYPVSVNPDLLVTHNAAILGILGVGKSFLALELVERMLRAGISVLCLDLTNQYAKELAPFVDADQEEKARHELDRIGREGKGNVSKNVEEGGSVTAFRGAVRDQLEAFLQPRETAHLRVLNPAFYEVWRQDSKPFKDQASMASLTPTEITRIITESLLDVLRDQGASDRARCCIVYEEAHSLIPEWSAVASEGDRTATNGTAKAILQGRKYGLGCLVITQRTANVTKSILNQCNTVFALRVFDATGMEFLKNYIGEDYAAVLSTLEDRHAVVFGRASSCRDPVLTRLNDRDEFLGVYRGRQLERAGEGI